jgi:hypothetical protein
MNFLINSPIRNPILSNVSVRMRIAIAILKGKPITNMLNCGIVLEIIAVDISTTNIANIIGKAICSDT